jgi:putative addiction module killer protein
MKTRESSVYAKWIKNLRDERARYRINARIERLKQGNSGDARPVGEGVSEMRIDYGPGYRVYYKNTGKEIVVLLCGGDKTTQDEDIKRAKTIAAAFNPNEED